MTWNKPIRHENPCQTCAGIVALVRGHTEEYGFSPSVAELRDDLGFSSPSVITYHLRVMEQSGVLIRKERNGRRLARSLTIAE